MKTPDKSSQADYNIHNLFHNNFLYNFSIPQNSPLFNILSAQAMCLKINNFTKKSTDFHQCLD